MRHIIRKTIYLVVIFIITGAVYLGYTYTARSLKSFVVKTLEDSFGARLSIAHMKVSFPLCLQLKGVKINDTIAINKVYLYPSPASAFLKKTFIFSSIKVFEPVIKIKKGQYENFTGFKGLKNGAVSASSKDSKAVFYVSRIDIENATLIYEEEGTNIKLVKIDANLKSPYTYLIGGRLLNFSVSGFVKNNNSDILSPLRLNGFIKGDFSIKAKLKAQDLALESLGPIYQKYLRDKIEKGSLNLDTKIMVSKDNLKADCFCRINDIILKGTANKITDPLIASFILGFDFKHRVVKIDNLQTNLLSLLIDKS